MIETQATGGHAVSMNLLARITIDPDICHGKPCVRHLRWPVEAVVDLVAAGMGRDEILADHPELMADDITACLQYARLVVSGETVLGKAA